MNDENEIKKLTIDLINSLNEVTYFFIRTNFQSKIDKDTFEILLNSTLNHHMLVLEASLDFVTKKEHKIDILNTAEKNIKMYLDHVRKNMEAEEEHVGLKVIASKKTYWKFE